MLSNTYTTDEGQQVYLPDIKGSLCECEHRVVALKHVNYHHWVERRQRSSFTSLAETFIISSLDRPSQSYHVALSSHAGSGSKNVRNFVISSGAPEVRMVGAMFFEKAYTAGSRGQRVNHTERKYLRFVFIQLGLRNSWRIIPIPCHIFRDGHM